jgi:hypothetical protein
MRRQQLLHFHAEFAIFSARRSKKCSAILRILLGGSFEEFSKFPTAGGGSI